jgi:hypothetical protein
MSQSEGVLVKHFSITNGDRGDLSRLFEVEKV